MVIVRKEDTQLQDEVTATFEISQIVVNDMTPEEVRKRTHEAAGEAKAQVHPCLLLCASWMLEKMSCGAL